MKVYQVIRRGSRWHVHMPDASADAGPSEDKLQIVAWACEVAKQNDSAVQVRDLGGRIEMTITYVSDVDPRISSEPTSAPSRTSV